MEEIKLLNNAFKIYNLNDTQNLSNIVLNYISIRLIANRASFEQMIEMLKSNISFNDILHAFDVAYKQRDYYKKANSYKQGRDYYSGVYPMPIGNIVVETNDVLEVIKYFVGGIKSRNTITISQTEYNEFSLSNMVLIIFAEALAKFNISRNTLMILPFEECFYEEFDEIIEIEDGEVNITQKKFSEKYIIYNQDDSFVSEIEKEKQKLTENNIDFEVIKGSLEKALDIINHIRPESVSIYTRDPSVAYNFINLASSQNVFVNSSLLNSEKLHDKINKFYYKKKIMYPSGRKFDLEEYYKQYTGKMEENAITEDNTNNNSVEKTNHILDKENNEMALVEIVNPWYKRIFEKIKNLFSKK